MVGMFRLSIKNRRMKKTTRSLKGAGNLPRMNSSAMMEWGKIVERDLKNSARQAHIVDNTGMLLRGKGIEWRQAPGSSVGCLFMRLYGIYLDSMKPHWVNLKRSRGGLMAWANQARHPSLRKAVMRIQSGMIDKYSLHVRAHPFIRTGFLRARPKLKAIIKKHVERAMMGG